MCGMGGGKEDGAHAGRTVRGKSMLALQRIYAQVPEEVSSKLLSNVKY